MNAGQRCENLLATKIREVSVRDVQADEIWTFVGKKQANKQMGDTAYVGDAWCFIAIERHSKLVLAFELGKRTVTSATRFITKLAAATSDERFQLTTDGLNAYPYPVGNILVIASITHNSSRSTTKRRPKTSGATARPA